MTNDNLIRYEEALEILSGLPAPIRSSICRRIIYFLTTRGDELARRSMLPNDHIEKAMVAQYIWYHIFGLAMKQKGLNTRDAKTAMVRMVPNEMHHLGRG